MLNAEVAAWNRLEAKVTEAIDLAKALGSPSTWANGCRSYFVSRSYLRCSRVTEKTILTAI